MTFTRFVVVAGLSGAGTSQAMKAFEDAGFYCLDRLPPALVDEFVALAARAHVPRLALSLEGRIGGAFGDLSSALEALERSGTAFDLLFLEADDETLMRRYSETRRRHPRAGAGSLERAIVDERADLAELRARATLVLDTSSFTHAALKARIFEAYADDTTAARLTVAVVAFGFKHGLPREADLVFDVRFLPNPNYVDDLRALTGADAPVAKYMDAQPETRAFLARLFGLIDFLLPLYANEGKSRLTIAIGCTGGRHRSVYIAERLAEHVRERAGATVTLEFRELAAA